MKKIIHVIPNYFPKFGGSVKTVSDFLKAFPESEAISFDTEILEQRLPFDERVHHFKCGDFPWNKDTYFISKKTRQAAEKIAQKANIIFCHQLFRAHNSWVKYFCEKQKIPYIVVPHGAMDPWVFTYRAFRKKAWMKFFGLNFLHDAASILTATKFEAAKLKQSNENYKNVTTNYWPTEFSEVSDKEKHRRDLRRKLKIPNDTRLLLFIGRFDPCKNLSDLIKYFAASKVKQTHLLIVGMDFYYTKEDLQKLIDKTGCEKIHVLGEVFGEDKEHLYAAVDAYISLSFKENFSYTAAESLASGLPVLLSPGNDLSGDLNSDVAWLMKTSTKEEVCKTIEAFDQINQFNLDAMGAKAKLWAKENLGYGSFTKRTTELIERVL